jgi:hypothetical protein
MGIVFDSTLRCCDDTALIAAAVKRDPASEKFWPQVAAGY